jgi:ABC-type cobalamin/Fe3+-siderophores transport system ATPase subunit
MDGDTIDVMSPGKKALVLLKLLISLAESNCPILIDQPEDDLDNRSIFNDLIPFIKTKKKDRQIIIVTHNANIVLGSDAEEIIIANQNGRDSPQCERRFEYRSGSIENAEPVCKVTGELADGILNCQGIQQHICEILEGGVKAFELRKHKYHI